MSTQRKFSEFNIVWDLGQHVCERVAKEVIEVLKEAEGGLSGDDSGLGSVWDELCVQFQVEESIYWDVYEMTVRDCVAGEVSQILPFERDAAWLQTEEGSEYQCEGDAEDPDSPVSVSDIIKHIVENHVYEEAKYFRNDAITAYINGS